MNQKQPLLGILGGLGPMSTVYFYELLTAHTKASSDADHLDLLISSRATTPDRTAFILGRSQNDPLPVMIEEAKRLERAGAELLVIPCNTAHYFYDGLKKSCQLPILNIIEETVAHLHRNGIQKFGLLATAGTVASGSYDRVCQRYGIECITPTPGDQETVTSIIYESIKQNKPVDRARLMQIADKLIALGCQRLVLGCTELSLLNRDNGLDPSIFVDSLEVLAWRTIVACHKEPIGFSADFDVGKTDGEGQ